MASFDPFEILNVPPTSSQAEIKKAYYRLSKVLHPDKETGDEKSFMMLSKAYQALTDDVAKENYEKYGNPDGPGAMSFGIALPSWIVEKENSVWVLGLYGLVFMVAMPSAVGVWWYRSIRFSGDKVLLDTTQMYFYFIHKTPHMLLKRALMVLAASLEFDKRHNSQVQERQSDNDEVPAVSAFFYLSFCLVTYNIPFFRYSSFGSYPTSMRSARSIRSAACTPSRLAPSCMPISVACPSIRKPWSVTVSLW